MQDTNGTNVIVTGRIVWTSGDLFKGTPKKDPNTGQQRMNKQGEPMCEYGFGLAIPKPNGKDPNVEKNFMEIWNAMHQEVFAMYPQAAQSGQIPPGFAMKYKDGDKDVDQKGEPYSKRTGYAGHIVIACTTSIPIKFFKFDQAQGCNVMINEGIKCGDYVDAQLTVKAHGPVGQGKPGLYVNPMAVRFNSYGEAIVNAPSGDNIFGSQAPTAWGSSQPVGNSAPVVPTQQPQGGAPQPGTPAPQGMPSAPQQPAQQPQQGMPQPNYGVLPEAHQPQPQANGAAQGMPQPQGMPAPPQSSGHPPQFNANENIPF